MTAAAAGERAGAFIATKEHRRFAEFADAVRKHRYIGLCFGAAGVGKTCSARRYARWDVAEPLLTTWGPRDASDDKVYAALAQHRAIFYTPTVCCPFRELHGGIAKLISRVGICINSHLHRGKLVQTSHSSDLAEVLIVDEAERLTNTALDQLRDLFDRTGLGVILVGMPGIEKRLSRYPQLYSRVGFAHHYQPLQSDELAFVLTRHWRQLRRPRRTHRPPARPLGPRRHGVAGGLVDLAQPHASRRCGGRRRAHGRRGAVGDHAGCRGRRAAVRRRRASRDLRRQRGPPRRLSHRRCAGRATLFLRPGRMTGHHSSNNIFSKDE